MELVRNLQRTGALGFRIKESKEKGITNLLFFRRKGLTQEEVNDVQECRQLLQLDPDADEFQLVFGVAAESNREIAVQTRSLIQIMLEAASQIELPEAHITEGRATPGFPKSAGGGEAFLSIRYRNLWFWIDDRDIKTKRNFAFLMYLFSLAETGAKQPLPLITIPAQ